MSKTVYAIGGVALLAYLFSGKKKPETAAAQAQPQPPAAAPARKGRPAPPQAQPETQVQNSNNEDDMSAREKAVLTIYKAFSLFMKQNEPIASKYVVGFAKYEPFFSDSELIEAAPTIARIVEKTAKESDRPIFDAFYNKMVRLGADLPKRN